ncbi:CPBP family intramembrane metalloprotease [Salmonella enterica]|nr:CPBP family intramembrane metalloprotease [Salmonella enterica]EDW4355892.1 CPBP family intramembrane metalloprotease [Salmonella enterica subsp. salamae]HCM1883632.1 CPBP family intramembrane metalloprotease [Salmonella enterica subsp. salamae serovar 60:z10:z39]EAX8455664.1 CPBP family intramembrane metalloprotease [Salmonella enterica]EAX8553789.1 CPBP family intramembrane metalloprotease [Salmonella enterica]
MPVNTLDKIRHSLSCVAVLFGLFGIFVFASFSPFYACLYSGGLAAPFLYIIVFVYAIAAWSIYSKYYPFLSFGRLSFMECFVPVLALVCLTFLYSIFSGPEPWIAELSRQFFLHKFLNTLAICFLAPVAEEIIFREFLLNSSIGWGRYARISGIIITSLAFAFMHTQYLFAVTFAYLFIFSSILCVVRMRSGGLMIPIMLHILNNAWAIGGILFSAIE